MNSSVKLLATIALALAAPAARAVPVSFTGLGDLPGGDYASWAWAISADGSTVVGESSSSPGYQAIRWTTGSGMVGLGDLPGGVFASSASGVSADGSVVVGRGRSALGTEAFRSISGMGMVGLGDLPGGAFFSQAYAVSANGSVVVGTSTSGGGQEAFRWTPSGMIGLGDLPGGSFYSIAKGVSGDGTTVVGRSDSNLGGEAFRWTTSNGMVGLGDLPGGFAYSDANAISADGLTIVGTSDSAFGLEAFRWTPGSGMVGLGDLPGGDFTSIAYAVSADGSVVVGRGTSIHGAQAVLWDQVNGMRRLQDVLTVDYGLNLSGWNLIEARAISADGRTIVGHGYNPNGRIEAWIAVVPEPSSMVLAVAGFGAVFLCTRRRRLTAICAAVSCLVASQSQAASLTYQFTGTVDSRSFQQMRLEMLDQLTLGNTGELSRSSFDRYIHATITVRLIPEPTTMILLVRSVPVLLSVAPSAPVGPQLILTASMATRTP